jgi:hypothetical protein
LSLLLSVLDHAIINDNKAETAYIHLLTDENDVCPHQRTTRKAVNGINKAAGLDDEGFKCDRNVKSFRKLDMAGSDSLLRR